MWFHTPCLWYIYHDITPARDSVVISEGTQTTPQQRAYGIGIAITAAPSALTKRAGSMRYAVCTFVWFSSLLLFSLSAEAQYRFNAWTSDDGLPQNIIRGMHQTPDGYLWIATLDGVARFDGVHFTIFNKGNTPGIVSNRIGAMVGGQGDDLWLTTENGRVTRYHKGSFQTYGKEQGLPEDDSVKGITADNSGVVWVLLDGAIARWDEAVGRFSRLTLRF